MRRISFVPEMYRQSTGNHINWLDEKQGGQKSQDKYVRNMSHCIGDQRIKSNAHLPLQFLFFLSLIQNSNSAPFLKREYEVAAENSVSFYDGFNLLNSNNTDYSSNIAQQISAASIDNRIVKRSVLGAELGAKPELQNRLSKKHHGKIRELLVLVKKDFHPDVRVDIYNSVVAKTLPGEIKNIDRKIKLYKSAIAKIEINLSKKGLRSLLLQTASKLYALTGNDDDIQQKRMFFAIQLYHLEKLSQGKFKIDFRPFGLTPNPANDQFSTYEAVESQIASQLIESVVENRQNIPPHYTITYGPAYQARKSLVAYALHAYGIRSQQELKKENYINKSNLYRASLDYLQAHINPTLLDEIANHFYFSFYYHYMANPDINLAINSVKVKKMRDFNQKEKIAALIYHFNSGIEIKYKPKKNAKEMVFNMAQDFLFIASPKKRLQSRSALSKGKGKIKIKQENNYVNIKNNIEKVQVVHQNKKGPLQKIKKPNRADFANEASFLVAKDKYEQYLKERVSLTSNSDLSKRKNAAINKIKSLDGAHDVKITQESSNGFTLTTAKDDPGSILVLNSHAWSDKYSGSLKMPAGKTIYFLGPDGKVLLEAPQLANLLPTSNLVAGSKYPSIYSTFSDKGLEVLSKKDPQLASLEQVKNYKLKHYELTSNEEIKLAIIENRLKKDQVKMDFLTVDELSGEKKLSAVTKLMKRGELLQNYDKVIFYACREIKSTGVLKSLDLSSGYEINFTDIPISSQVRTKRSASTIIPREEIEFDGYYLYERFEVTNNKVASFIEGMLPYQII